MRDILISAQHIPGKVNIQADALSREISSNLEWSLNGEVFQDVISQTFIPEIDLFASNATEDCKVCLLAPTARCSGYRCLFFELG